ncbi:MAG: peptidase S41 [Acidobacteria bacterium]|nr:MAG: peptidase S41 [Acidobacteriota bacterium]
MKRAFVTVSALAFLLFAPVLAGINARMLRQPDVSQTQIAFVYAGDIWLAPKTGGTAVRLSSPAGEESFPKFSPDGSSLAYSANYDGNVDIYVVSVSGGLPKRVTHHPMSDRVLDWYPDGKSLLFASPMMAGRDRFNQLFKVSREGGLPEKLPVPYGEFGSISPDGKTLAFMPESQDFRTWKRYRGGWAPDIWLFDLQNLAARNITNSPAGDAHPMWSGKTIYFMSDRGPELRNNLWAYEPDSQKLHQVTQFADFDVRFPSIGPSEIVFEGGGRLYLLDLKKQKPQEVSIDVVTDEASLKPRAEKVVQLIQNLFISPTGKRVAFEARGDIFTVPAEHGPVINVTASSGVAERYPSWSPDGKWLAYWSDRSGEYELVVRPADGSGSEQSLTTLGPGFRYGLYWSPDSKKIAFVDQAMRLWIADRESKETKQIDKAGSLFHGSLQGFRFSWSPDSRWLAYDRDQDELGNRTTIFMYDTQKGEKHKVTSSYYDDSSPVFDPEGKYLYYLSNRSLRPVYGSFDATFVYPNAMQIVAVSLRSDVPSPIAPQNDEETGKEEKKKDEKKPDDKKVEDTKDQPDAKPADAAKDAAKDDEKKQAPKPVEIEFDGFEMRAVVLPPEAGVYSGLLAAEGKVLFVRRPRNGSAPSQKSTLCYFDLKDRKEEVVIEEIDGYQLSADKKKIVVRQSDSYGIIDLKPKQKIEKKLRIAEMETVVDPRAEWQQVFTDAWRFTRDYFYDPNMHGVNWNAIKEQYGKLIEESVTRWDVNFVLGEMIAELNASHTYRGGGDEQRAPERRAGLLGVDWAFEDGAYRIKHIVRGAAWDIEVRSPLAQPGLGVKEGDYVLAVNGLPLAASLDPWAALEGLAEKTVVLTVNSKPTAEGAKKVLLKTLSSEGELRQLEWIETSRKRVEEATGGRVGYIYVPSTGIDGQNELVRQFAAQFDKEGLIIDERFNSGGQIPDRFVELLNRDPLSYWAVRDGKDWQWPPSGNFGPKVMLINGWSGSGGDCFPYFFRKAGLGPLIGTRTWGGLIGLSGSPSLVDGGMVTVPTFRMYSTDGGWFAEGHGVDPDIPVINDPGEMAKGRDPQLERAIQEVQRLLKAKPFTPPKRPSYEDRSGRQRPTD